MAALCFEPKNIKRIQMQKVLARDCPAWPVPQPRHIGIGIGIGIRAPNLDCCSEIAEGNSDCDPDSDADPCNPEAGAFRPSMEERTRETLARKLPPIGAEFLPGIDLRGFEVRQAVRPV